MEFAIRIPINVLKDIFLDLYQHVGQNPL